jgi:UDP-N-acetylmuramoyl-L-alanyl-D-glutamate--2,6-diaminopimelate ligase
VLLSNLLNNLEVLEISGNPELEICGLDYDSRQIDQGFLFVAIPGFKTDGHNYIDAALGRGAVALVVERGVSAPQGVVVVKVPDTRLALAQLAASYYGNPSTKMRLIGITGTNGKTTTSYLIEEILQRQGYRTGLLGTISNRIGGKEFSVQHTTPESLELQKLLAQMVDVNSDYAVMEVSSHALALNRVEGCEFDVAVFTNLTQDHLDFHHCIEDYRNAKLSLFVNLGVKVSKSGLKYAVVNVDDAEGNRFAASTPVEVITYGIKQEAMVTAKEIRITPQGASFKGVLPSQEVNIKLNLTGRFSIYNALAALAVGWREGIELDQIRDALEAVPGVPGRFELVDCGQDFAVIVDYAHTPDGLENVLSTAREVASGRVITVFGCGGDRDRTKRPLMGEVVARLSDYAVVTSDNPRTEDPLLIIEDILPGICKTGSKGYEVIPDRREAIQKAMQQAKAGDMVVIAGKGHETYQLVGSAVLDFDDRKVSREILGELGLSHI